MFGTGGVARQRRVSAALAQGLAAHLPNATAHHRILDQVSKLRHPGADGKPLYEAITRPPLSLLARPETLRSLEAMSPEAWQLLCGLLDRSTSPEPAATDAGAAGAEAATALLLARLPEEEGASLVHLLAITSESVRTAFAGLGAGLRRCDEHPRPCPAAIYVRGAPSGAGSGAVVAAERRAAAHTDRLDDALLLVAADPRLAALAPLLRPGHLPSASVAGLLRGVLALRTSDARIGATHVEPATDLQDSVALALDESLGLTVRAT